jgi:glycosyltransferase involved in cell wall biosynthesis
VLEAMAAGLAVAATDLPGIRWALGPESPLAPAGDDAALAKRILGLIADSKQRATIGARNQATIATRFAPLAALEAYVQAIVSARRASGFDMDGEL